MIGEKNELKIFKEKLLFNSKLKNNKNKINYRVNLIVNWLNEFVWWIVVVIVFNNKLFANI